MIRSDLEYTVTQQRVEQFRSSMERLEANVDNLPPHDQQSSLQSMREWHARLTAQVREYEALKAGVFDPDSLLAAWDNLFEAAFELGRTLVAARIAKGLSIADLADLLDMDSDTLQEYEDNEYTVADSDTVGSVVLALHTAFQAPESAENEYQVARHRRNSGDAVQLGRRKLAACEDLDREG